MRFVTYRPKRALSPSREQVGVHGRFLEAGSVVQLEISGIGKLRNRLVKA
jgi:2-keto-4-pentenoate hydratase/2-oxohepta-3-ene-1,7-dioic acid hydratase in catechol pathway